MSTSAVNKLKNVLWPTRGPSGQPVYLQENGELLGYVTNLVKNKGGDITGYLVDSDGVEMRFPKENITKIEGGFIYQPIWYTDSKELLERLKAEETLNPGLKLDGVPEAKAKRLIKDAGGDLHKTVEEAKNTVKILIEKESSLKEQRDSLREKINDIAGTRMLGGSNRREFALTIIDLKRKTQIIESNLNKVQELLEGFRKSPFIDTDKIKKVNRSDEKKEMIPIEEKTTPSRRSEAGERIKKIRILKLEKNLADKQKQVAEMYIKERLKAINKETNELKEMAKENQENKKILKFLKNKIDSLEEEKKELNDKLVNVKAVTPESLATTEDLPERIETDEVIEDIPESRGIDAALISRIGSLILIGGLLVILILSLLGML